MRFEDAVKRTGGDSCGGQLIVLRNGKHVLVGRHNNGFLMPEATPEAAEILAEIADAKPAADDGAEHAGRRARAPRKPVEPVEPVEPVHADVLVGDAPIEPGQAHTLDVADVAGTEDSAG